MSAACPATQRVADLLLARENHTAYDPAAFDAAMAEAVAAVVARQVQAGVDIVSDGRPRRSVTRPTSRTGSRDSGGDQPRQVAPGPAAIPGVSRAHAVFAGKQSFKRQCCIGPIAMVERESLHKDIANLHARGGPAWRRRGVHECGLTGRRGGLPAQPVLPDARGLRRGHRGRDAREYEAIAAAGFVLQIDCPDLPWHATPGSRI